MKRIISEQIVIADRTLKRVWNDCWDERLPTMPAELVKSLGQFAPFGVNYSDSEPVAKLLQKLVLISFREFRKLAYGSIIDSYNRYPTFDEEACVTELNHALEDLTFTGALNKEYDALSEGGMKVISEELNAQDMYVDFLFSLCSDYVSFLTEVVVSPAGVEFIKAFYEESEAVYCKLTAIGYVVSPRRLERLVDAETGLPELIILELTDLEFVEAIQAELDTFDRICLAAKEYANEDLLKYIITINDRISKKLVGEHFQTGDIAKIYKMKKEVELAVNH